MEAEFFPEHHWTQLAMLSQATTPWQEVVHMAGWCLHLSDEAAEAAIFQCARFYGLLAPGEDSVSDELWPRLHALINPRLDPHEALAHPMWLGADHQPMPNRDREAELSAGPADSARQSETPQRRRRKRSTPGVSENEPAEEAERPHKRRRTEDTPLGEALTLTPERIDFVIHSMAAGNSYDQLTRSFHSMFGVRGAPFALVSMARRLSLGGHKTTARDAFIAIADEVRSGRLVPLEIPPNQPTHDAQIDEIVAHVANDYGLSPAEALKRTRTRDVAAHLCARLTVIPSDQIGDRLGLSKYQLQQVRARFSRNSDETIERLAREIINSRRMASGTGNRGSSAG